MKNNLIPVILIASILILGCETKNEKPFIIIGKSEQDMTGNTFKNKSVYMYQEKNGNKVMFWEFSNKYSIGDTIK